MDEFKVGDKVTSKFLRGVGVITEMQNLIAYVKGSHITYRDGNFVDVVREVNIGHLTKVPSSQENDTKQILEKFISGTNFKIGDKVTCPEFLIGEGEIIADFNPMDVSDLREVYFVKGTPKNPARRRCGAALLIHRTDLTQVETKEVVQIKEILEKFITGTKIKIDGVPTNSLDMLVNAIVRGNKIEEAKTININGYEVPEPCYDLVGISGNAFVVGLHDIVETKAECVPHYCVDSYRNGLVHLFYEAAELHQEALLSFTKKNETI